MRQSTTESEKAKQEKEETMKLVLSPRLKQVLCLVGRGLGNAEIAGVLQISVRTVKFHLRSVLQKVRSEGEALTRARLAVMWAAGMMELIDKAPRTCSQRRDAPRGTNEWIERRRARIYGLGRRSIPGSRAPGCDTQDP
jgi:DNA-binding CsgD family transcriptional regulator